MQLVICIADSTKPSDCDEAPAGVVKRGAFHESGQAPIASFTTASPGSIGLPDAELNELRLTLTAAFHVSRLPSLLGDIGIDWGTNRSFPIRSLVRGMSSRVRPPLALAKLIATTA